MLKDVAYGLLIVPAWKAMKSGLEVLLMLLAIVLLALFIRREYYAKIENFESMSMPIKEEGTDDEEQDEY